MSTRNNQGIYHEATRDQAISTSLESQRFLEHGDMDNKDKLTLDSYFDDLSRSSQLGELESDVEAGVFDNDLDILQSEATYVEDLVAMTFESKSYEELITKPELMQKLDYLMASTLLMPAFRSVFTGMDDYSAIIDIEEFDKKIDAIVGSGYTLPLTPDQAPTISGKKLMEITAGNPEAGKYATRYVKNLFVECGEVLKKGVRSHNAFFETDGSEGLSDEDPTKESIKMDNLAGIVYNFFDTFNEEKKSGSAPFDAILKSLKSTSKSFFGEKENWQKFTLGAASGLGIGFAGSKIGGMFGKNEEEKKENKSKGWLRGGIAGSAAGLWGSWGTYEGIWRKVMGEEELSAHDSFQTTIAELKNDLSGRDVRGMRRHLKSMKYTKDGDDEYIIGYGGTRTQIDTKNMKIAGEHMDFKFKDYKSLFKAAMWINSTRHRNMGNCLNETPFTSFDNTGDAMTTGLLTGGVAAGGIGYMTRKPDLALTAGLLAGGAGAYMAGTDGSIIGGISVQTAELGSQTELGGGLGFLNMNGADLLFPELRENSKRDKLCQHLNEMGGRKAGNAIKLSDRKSARELQQELESSVNTSTGSLSPAGVQRGTIDVTEGEIPGRLMVHSWGRPQMQTELELVGYRSGLITHVKLSGCDYLIPLTPPGDPEAMLEAEKKAVRLANFTNHMKHHFEACCEVNEPFSFMSQSASLVDNTAQVGEKIIDWISGNTMYEMISGKKLFDLYPGEELNGGAGLLINTKNNIYGHNLGSAAGRIASVRALSMESMKKNFPFLLENNNEGLNQFIVYLNSLKDQSGGSRWKSQTN